MQFARPNVDVSAGGWTTNTGGTTNLWNALDESSANDADFVQSASNPVLASYEVHLSDITDPAVSSGHVFRYRYRKNNSAGRQVDLIVEIRDGAVTVAQWTHTNITGPTWLAAAQTLTGTQADTITNYSDLRVRFTANAVGTGSGRSAQVSWSVLETPDATANQTISPGGVASTEAVGALVAAGPVALTGVASTESVGSIQLAVGGVSISLPGIASTDAVGSLGISTPASVWGTYGGNAYAVSTYGGTKDPQSLGFELGIGGIADTSSVGSITLGYVIPLAGIASTESVGTIALGMFVVLTGVSSTEGVGSVTAVTGAITISLAGVASTESVGTLGVAGGAVTVSLSGIDSTESVGSLTIAVGGVSVSLTGIASAESVGALTLVTGAIVVALSGVASSESVGSLTLFLADPAISLVGRAYVAFTVNGTNVTSTVTRTKVGV